MEFGNDDGSDIVIIFIFHHLKISGGMTMKLSTRNIVKGKVVDVKEDGLMAKVKIDVGNGNILTAIVTSEAVKDLGVKTGEDICALIKATSVMLAKE